MQTTTSITSKTCSAICFQDCPWINQASWCSLTAMSCNEGHGPLRVERSTDTSEFYAFFWTLSALEVQSAWNSIVCWKWTLNVWYQGTFPLTCVVEGPRFVLDLASSEINTLNACQIGHESRGTTRLTMTFASRRNHWWTAMVHMIVAARCASSSMDGWLHGIAQRRLRRWGCHDLPKMGVQPNPAVYHHDLSWYMATSQ